MHPCMYLFVFKLYLLISANKTITKPGEWHWKDDYRSRMVVLLFSRKRDLTLLGQVKDRVHDLALSLCDC